MVREMLFNWLQGEVAGARCLDLFAGSGALGFEAASRGAESVLQVEGNPIVARALKENCRRLEVGEIRTVTVDVRKFLHRFSDEAFDLVFLDPPFGRGWVASVCHSLEEGGWLKPTARIYVEAERELDNPEVPANWERLRHRRVGDVGCHLYRRVA